MTSSLHGSSIKDAARVLFFAPAECLPANTGGRLRNYHLAKALASNARVTYLSFSEAADEDSAMQGLASVCERVIAVPREQGYGLTNLIRGVVGRRPITVLNYTTP